ncbi:DUF3570 domain-containing protein [Allomuricauda sp. NBRC 101325]|uniref:DUF3570 domain-containing protein n=1 Tax=Allomuricauda sp. NBRC 101325 TaxID=1113758 RepID=UPI0024A3C6B3|nr:DUF3570 domain-containing protein [Muricauda sp. NBRC 101325]GLU42894.1 hypothetical protein Musp01_05180 [Muricauda sp. NBRC 101325]
MEEKQEVVVVAINEQKHGFWLILLLMPLWGMAQQENASSYKKRVLESTEVDILSSYYDQTGNNAAVTGGLGTEELSDVAGSIVVSIPLNADDVLSVDLGISTYTSASSSNLNPFDITKTGGVSGASTGNGGIAGGDDDEEDDHNIGNGYSGVIGSPWVASSGASRQDTWGNVTVGYSHSSDDRDQIVSAYASFSTEYDYMSIGFGGGYTRLFNEKNTEVSVKGSVYLDNWLPRYPTELDSYLEAGGNLNGGFFTGVDILDSNGQVTDKNGSNTWRPIDGFGLISDKKRNSYALTLSFSQILGKNTQMSVFADVVRQDGWLANPMQRVYFADVNNYFIGNPASIPNYTSSENKDVFMLADDIERLPNSRLKIPIGFRLNQYINEIVTVRTYYRYYFDDWGLQSHTASIELPIKISQNFTLYPSYRYYTQNQVDYFAPFDAHLSTEQYYTSDYDLSQYDAYQYGFGVSYTDIFTRFRTWHFGLKSIDLKYNNYHRTTGLKANYFGLGFKFEMN